MTEPTVSDSTPSSSEQGGTKQRKLCLLGSTGSIGTQTLDVVRKYPSAFRIDSLSANTNTDLLISQAREFRPRVVAIGDTGAARQVQAELEPLGIVVVAGDPGLIEVASHPELDCVVAAIVGFAGLSPVVAALRAGHRVALANKETLVVAGHLVTDIAASSGASLVPVDSEHSAIFQCIQGEDSSDIEGLVLTASGGPFRERAAESFHLITRDEALAHPNWEMGAKITVDSATMMNKGLEVIEARWLFDVGADQIDVLVHPQSIIHSIVNFVDGSSKAQLGIPDMRVPIQYALTYPRRWNSSTPLVRWADYPSLTFETPSFDRFPCLGLAYDALRRGGSAPAVLNAANEAAVGLFLNDEIRFVDIATSVEYALAKAAFQENPTLEDLYHIDKNARRLVLEHKTATLH